jgi:hypothetical protein
MLLISHIGYGQTHVYNLDQLFKPKKIYLDSLLQPPNPSFSYNRLYRVEELPLFCKTEHKWSKLSGINVRMRLGSLDYVNKLEGK